MNYQNELKKISITYTKLAKRVVKLNDSYLELNKFYQDMILISQPKLLNKLIEKGASPVTIINKMVEEKRKLEQDFPKFLQLVNKVKPLFSLPQDQQEIDNVINDCQVFLKFLKEMDLDYLVEMFRKIREQYKSLQ